MNLQILHSEISPSRGLSRARKLTLFFAGWGMDARPFLSYLPQDRDVAVCYDYAEPAKSGSLAQIADDYDDVLVVAWSFGVWAAARELPAAGLRYRAAIAVNGTTTPIDDRTGIPAEIFAGTLAKLTPQTLRKFHRRMFLSPAEYATFAAAAPERDFSGIKTELQAVATTAAAARGPASASVLEMNWTLAVVADRDRIFPPENLRRAWIGTRLLEIPGGHFPPSWRSIFDGTALNGTVPDGD